MTQVTAKRHRNSLRQAFSSAGLVANFSHIVKTQEHVKVAGLAGSSYAMLIGEMFDQLGQTFLLISSNEKLAADLAGDLKEVCQENDVLLFPAWGVYPYDWLTPPLDNVSQRLEALWNLSQGTPKIIVTTAEAIRQKTLTPKQLSEGCFDLKIGAEYDLTEIARKLTSVGYERVPITEEVGTYSIRGGILDVFPFTATNPVRCEFFGDFIDSMRYFNVLSQRSFEALKNVAIIPRREFLLPADQIEALVDCLDPEIAEIVRDKCLGGFDYPGLEWVSALFALDRGTLFDFLPTNTKLFFADRPFFESQTERYAVETVNLYEQAREKFPQAPTPEQVYLTTQQLTSRWEKFGSIEQVEFASSQADVNFGTKDHPSFNGQVSILRQMIQQWLDQGTKVFILSDNELQKQRLEELLSEFSASVTFVVSELHRGFIFPEIDTVFLTDHQIFDRHFIRHRKRRIKEGVAISSYNALEIGDYVVHVDYGIGRYRGLKEIKVNNRRRECLLIYYSDDDKLYVPLEEFHRVQKYVGKEGAPSLTRLGGKNWEKVKARTKKAIADMAQELVALYAARKANPGYAFPADDEWMRQLEASFPYEETIDQLKAIDAVKADMQAATPMDRLICGDVGFGKTEVAIRAAIKAIAAGKQVAVLVPTTILAQQHLNTFKNRLSQFPVKVEMLSRFRSRQEQKETIAALEAMQIDVVIGTHRLLQKDLKIPNLGLIVVDEEQRFGVAHKEKLKKLRQNADCITLTATPIPRTLQMSLLGARDMSVINTSPKDRQAIITEIAEFDPKIIYEAINFEVARKGQVYFVHNRVETIESMHHYLTKLLKHIRVAVAHGQMPEHELEEVMLGFLHKDYDVLLSSAIIESGIDIPTVNTIIVNRADRFGLAQLYQLRGRVGRSQERAYSYLLVPPVKQLTDTARKRLKAIEQHTELGSGFHLAMKDLEIRGAGNLLGPQQHGFIEEVGFDLYCRLLEEAVAELKGETVVSDFEVKLDFDCDALIPIEYVEDSRQRVDIYRKIAEAKEADDLNAVSSELVDRFGKYGNEVANLLDIAAIKLHAKQKKISRIKLSDEKLTIGFNTEHLPGKKQIESLRVAAPYKMEFDASEAFIIKITFPKNFPDPVREAKKLLLIL